MDDKDTPGTSVSNELLLVQPCLSRVTFCTALKDQGAERGPWRSSVPASCLQTELTFIG